MNIGNCTLYVVKFLFDFIPCFWQIFVDFQNAAAGLYINNSINKDVYCLAYKRYGFRTGTLVQ